MKDYIIDSDFDLLFKNGDFVVSNSEEQAISLLLLTSKGQWKSSLLTGIALEQYINSNETDTAKTQINYGLQNDGANVQKVVFKDGKMQIEAVWNI